MNTDKKWMLRCIELAKKGIEGVSPNPMVGALLVYDNKVISEGWHQKFGEKHAEVHAIENLKDKSLLNKSTLYVNLEPCNHHGKTPPCSQAIINAKIPKVVIGTQDPFSKVNGSGIDTLLKNNVSTIVGVAEDECKILNKRFFTYHIRKRPYIILKWAESRDGFIAPEKKENIEPVWISGMASRKKVHQWRSEEDAILVGCQTVIDDNPKLTTRLYNGKNPLRVILDPNNRIPKNAHVLNSKEETLVFSKSENTSIDNIFYQKIPFENAIQEILKSLYEKEINSIIVEGGKKTLDYFITENIWDEIRIFKSPEQIKKGVESPKFSFLKNTPDYKKNIEKDTLSYFYNSSFNLTEIF